MGRSMIFKIIIIFYFLIIGTIEAQQTDSISKKTYFQTLPQDTIVVQVVNNTDWIAHVITILATIITVCVAAWLGIHTIQKNHQINIDSQYALIREELKVKIYETLMAYIKDYEDSLIILESNVNIICNDIEKSTLTGFRSLRITAQTLWESRTQVKSDQIVDQILQYHFIITQGVKLINLFEELDKEIKNYYSNFYNHVQIYLPILNADQKLIQSEKLLSLINADDKIIEQEISSMKEIVSNFALQSDKITRLLFELKIEARKSLLNQLFPANTIFSGFNKKTES